MPSISEKKERKSWLGCRSKIIRTSLIVLISIVLLVSFAAITSEVLLTEIISTVGFYLFWILLPGLILVYLLTKDLLVSLAGCTPVGLFVHIVFYSFSLLSHTDRIYSIFYPTLFVLSFGVLCARGSMLKCFARFSEINEKQILITSLSVFFMLLYRHWVMDDGNRLPGKSGDSAFCWVDIAWFMGNSASLKTAAIPTDYRLAGLPLRYHFIYQQLLAACSKVTGYELFDLYSRVFPSLLSAQLIIVLCVVGLYLGLGTLEFIFLLAFSVFSAGIGWRVAFEAGADTFLNLFTSPSMLLGLICFSAAPIFLAKVRNTKYSFNPKMILLLAILSFVLVGTKISIAAVTIAGIGAWWCISKFDPAYVVGMLAGAGVSYCIYFLDSSGGAVGAARLSLPNGLGLALLTPPPILFRFIGPYINQQIFHFLSILLRYLPFMSAVAFAFCADYRRWTERLKSIQGFHLACGLAGIFAGLILGDRYDPLHFYHSGIFCLGFYAAIETSFIRSSVQKFILVTLVVLAFIPLVGDRFVPYFQGFSSQGKPLLSMVDLDYNLIRAFKYVRANSDVSAVTMTNRVALSDSSLRSSSLDFFGSAFMERPVFLEGFGFNSLRGEQGKVPGSVANRLEIQQAVFNPHSTFNDVSIALGLSRATWIVWDKRVFGPIPVALEKLTTLRFLSGDVAVLKKGR